MPRKTRVPFADPGKAGPLSPDLDLEEVFPEGLAREIRAAGPRAEALARALIRTLREAPPRRVINPEDAFLLVADMVGLEREALRVILLNARLEVLAAPTVYVGAVDRVAIRPAEIFREAIRHNAVSLIVAHNHPSGDPQPSLEDIQLTRELIMLGRLLDIAVLDHIVIGRGGAWISIREAGSLPQSDWDVQARLPGM